MLENLKMATQEEVAELLNTSRNQVAMLREVGLLRGIKTGKGYMFSQEEIRRFQCDYAGCDVSNKVKAIDAYNLMMQKKATAPTVTAKATLGNHFQ